MSGNWIRTSLLTCWLAGSLAAANGYLVHNLVSDLPGLADHVDKNLVNPWGNAFGPTTPFWIANNHSGTSTLYDGTGTPLPLVVDVPAPGGPGTQGAVTAIVFNSSTGFVMSNQKPATYLFCSEDGAITGWNAGATAEILVDNSASHANYKGCALGGTSDAPLLYAANFASGAVDVFDGSFQPVSNASAFVDPTLPSGFAPFNIAVFGGKVYVTYAKPDDDKEDDVPGPGNGYVSVFDSHGALQAHLIAQGPLNSPWGMAIAPATFGAYAGALLVGNFGDGRINAFDAATGQQLGTLNDVFGGALEIPGLWSLQFGNGARSDAATLYFTAGIPGPFGDAPETHGLMGSIQPDPSFAPEGIVNSAAASAPLGPNAFITISGGALSARTRAWDAGDFDGNNLPTDLDGVGVMVNGEPAYVSYVSPSQINALLPADLVAGPVQIQTINNGLVSQTQTVTLDAAGPAFFTFAGGKYVAATHADGSLSAPAGLISGATTTPAVGGETLVLYANGFGATEQAIPNGQLITTPLPLAVKPTVTIGGASAEVVFAGLSAAGLYQLNVVVPGGLAPGDNAVVAQVGPVATQPNVFVSIGQ
jgi:uncharacterized protein (TIGR03118 family)